ncbi:MAG: hypothetical protein AVDCRST_MAG51-2700, partial [uncultured Ramlibacter sp.]
SLGTARVDHQPVAALRPAPSPPRQAAMAPDPRRRGLRPSLLPARRAPDLLPGRWRHPPGRVHDPRDGRTTRFGRGHAAQGGAPARGARDDERVGAAVQGLGPGARSAASLAGGKVGL